jgi:hypothetical protein
MTTKTRLLYNTNPNPRCAVTKSACSFSVITVAPRAIWPNTAPAAMAEKIFVERSGFFPLITKTAVRKTKSPVVAAIDLWVYSIKKSADGTKPWGQSGQSGHDKPTPLELTYPPINIKPNKTHKVNKENVRRNLS